MAYYYLISSLPMLKADGEMPISYDEFLKMCKGSVSDMKYEALRNLSVLSDDGPLISKWADFYGVLNGELTYQRNERLGKKSQTPDIKDEGMAKTVTMALNDENPLNAEETLLALEFQKVDELIGTHYFDDYALMGYALKLKLLERKKSFNKEAGKKEFSRILDRLEEQIVNMEQE